MDDDGWGRKSQDRGGVHMRNGGGGTVHVLLVGINSYPAATARKPLRGCRNDIEAARAWLRSRVTGPLRVKPLLDGEATVRAVRDGIAEHLGQAGPGDTALFWFSGHGAQYEAVGAAALMKEGTGRSQAVVCADGLLADTELRALLDGVAAGGAHTTAVMDCCYSGGVTRDDEEGPTARFLPPDPDRPLAAPVPLVPESRTAVPAGPGTGPFHITLAASRIDQQAYEDKLGGRTRGLFSHSLLGVLAEVGPTATYREILAATHCRVQILTAQQHPVMIPHDPGGPADLPFLGGKAREPSPQLLRHGRDGWEVDHGSLHGMESWSDDDPDGTAPDGGAGGGTEFVVTGDGEPRTGARVVRVREVRHDRALVTPHGWRPDPAQVYPVAVSALALPPAGVEFDAPHAPRAGAWLREAVAAAGPGGGPTPLLAVTPSGPDRGAARQSSPVLRFKVVVRDGLATVLTRDGTAAVPPLPLGDPADAMAVVDCLAHLTRWYQLLELSNFASALSVRLEVSPWDSSLGTGTPTEKTYANAELEVPYEGGPGRWRKPLVSVRIHNNSTRPLWCLLLNLNDSYGSHPGLYEPDFIGPGLTGYALDGGPVQLSLPKSRPVRPGAYARDWLKLIVAEGEFNTVPFILDPWQRGARGRHDGQQPDGMLRLAAPAVVGRNAEAPPQVGPWTTRTVALRTVVPDATGG
ncbi:caspase family protein [Streptomyces sp. 150FB]|uniref:caspase family protein n=1 Tax=Streptomyces sp. 150FB TaxID=1576605 RepID=UPI000AAF86D3|nr:caspase family protein [Streptomyces sp. 150FB]